MRKSDELKSRRAAIITEMRGITEAPAGTGRGTLWLVGFDREHLTPVASGENRGRTLAHAHVVRGVANLGAWEGAALRIPARAPAGEQAALLLQGSDGRILGAARV